MKKFLQSSCQWLVMLVAMFAMSVTAMAQYATISSVSPATGTISLDDREDGLHYFTIKFDEKIVENYGSYTGQSIDGFTLTDATGKSYAFSYLQGWASDEYWENHDVNFATTEAIKEAGTYTFHAPAGVFTFAGGKTNAEINLEWTLTAKTQFEFDHYDIQATGVQGSNPWGPMKSLTGFKVAIPEGITLANVPSSVSATVRVGADESNLNLAVSEEDGQLVFTFPSAYSETCNVRVTIAEGTFTTTTGLTSKVISTSFSVDPMTYFDISVNPGWGDTYEGVLNSLEITVPDGVVVTAISNTNQVNFGGWLTDPESWSQTGNVVTLVFPADKAGQPGTTGFWYSIPSGLFITDGTSTNSSTYAYDIVITAPAAPKVPMTVQKLVFDAYEGEPITSGATVDNLSYFYIYFNERLADDEWTIPAGMTLTDEKGNSYAWSYVYGYSGDRYNSENAVVMAKLVDINYGALKAAGTYTLHIPEGAYTSASGNPSEEVNYTFVIEDKVVKFVSASISDTVGGMNAPTLTFDNEVLVTSNYLEDGDVTLYKGSTQVDLEGLYYVYIQSSGNRVDVWIYNSSYNTFWPLEAGDYTLRIAGKYFTSATGNPYTEAEYIEVPFTVTAPADLAISAESEGQYYATYYDGSHNWIVPAGVTAYWVSGVDGTSVTLEVAAEAGEIVNSTVAVLLVSDEAITAPLAYTSEYGNDYYYDSLLRGASQDQLVQNSSWGDQYTFYMLSKKDGVVGFYWDPATEDEGATLNAKAHKAYLRVPVETPAASQLRINFGGETTGIDAIATESVESIFNLQGQRVIAPAKGSVYVKNGKKVIVK